MHVVRTVAAAQLLACAFEGEAAFFGEVVYAAQQVDVFLLVHAHTSCVFAWFQFAEFGFPIAQEGLTDAEELGNFGYGIVEFQVFSMLVC